MMKKKTRIWILIFGIVVIFIAKLLTFTMSKKDKYSNNESSENKVENSVNVEDFEKKEANPDSPHENKNLYNLINNKCYVTEIELAANDIEGINGADPPLFVIPANSKIILIDYKNEYSKIKYECQEGWIPTWYIADHNSEIKLMKQPSFKLIELAASMYLYPETKTLKYSHDIKLQEDKVVKVIAEYNDFYCIEYIKYDCPEYDLTWIKKENTKEYDGNIGKEGFINKTINVLDEKGCVTDDEISGFVEIIEVTEDGLYKIKGRGGQKGYVKKTDISPIDATNF